MIEQFTELQKNLVTQIAKNNGFKDYTVEDSSKSSKGHNYIGQIILIVLKDSDKKIELVFKKAPSFSSFRKSFPIRETFLNEIYIYDIVFPTFAKFQQKNGLKNLFESYPKYYGQCSEEFSETIVMENLIKEGYSHWDRTIPMDFDHVNIVMAEYGKLHAVSFAMKKKEPEVFEKIIEGLRYEQQSWQVEMIKDTFKNVGIIMKKSVEGNSILENAYQRVMINMDQYLSEVVNGSQKHLVITHGDCWCNNLLFKYGNSNDSKKPTKLRIVDWQMASYGLPLSDIIYFFYASSPKEILYDYEKYLKVYHDSLSDYLKQMSCDPEELFPYKDLLVLWKKFTIYGLYIASFSTRMMFVDTKDAPQFDENTASLQDFFGKFEGMANSDKVNARICDLFNYAIDNKFI